jgi:hypothetical protein
MRLLNFFRKRRQIAQAKRQRKQEKFLQMYFSYLYQKNDAGKIEIPHFLKAKDTVADLRHRGLIAPVYNHILKRGIAC